MQKHHELEIYGMSYGGAGIARLDGKICFVEGGLPGEKVRFVVDSDKKRFIVGRAVEILSAAACREKPPCPYYGNCGGCQYQHVKYEAELSYKAEQVQEILSRMGGFKEYIFEGITPSPVHYGYRSSVTLHRSFQGYGYFTRDNRTVIAVDKCLLAAEGINGALGRINASETKKDITVKCDKAGGVWISGHPGHRFFKDSFMRTELTFSPLAFSQPNRKVASLMVKKLREWIMQEQRETLFDFYSGVGFFGILMRDLFKSVVGVEDSRVAVSCAGTTKKDLSIGNIRFYCAAVEEKALACYEKLKGKVNTLILDPPRTGIDKDLILRLAELKDAQSLYYISCDPAILARDAAMLTQSQLWKLERVACFDMFPRTKHIESIAVFKKR
ncbi:MAG: TRAM domain-containing protein [Candidatus Omnitrophota bacterium]